MANCSRSCCARGVALVETLIGVVLLATAGIAWITLAGQNARTVSELHARERQLSEAVARMEWVTLRSASDLDAMEGRRRFGEFDVTVTHLAPRIYDAVIADTLGHTALLHTSIYALDPARDAR